MASPEVPHPHRRSWLKPDTWHLRTRLILLAMTLLIAICGAVGVVSYASMDAFLTRQLDDQLSQAAERSNDPGRPPAGGFNGRDPLDARGQSVGTLNARIVDGQVNSAGFLAPDTTRSPLSTEDKETLLALSSDGQPVDRALSNGNYRLVAVKTNFGDVLVTGLPLAGKESTLTSLVWTFVLVSLGGLLLVGFVGTVLIRRTMKPLEQLSEVATRVSRLPLDAGEVALAVRVPPSNSNPGTEVGSVGHALNLMLDNVASALQARQKSETKVRQFVADASHELRTPLTAIRGYTELMRMTEDFTPDGEKSLARVQSQSERMTALVEDLLLLARLDEGQPLKLSEVDLTQLVVESVSDEKVMAPGHSWRLELPDEPVVVDGDASQLRQVLMNLLSNARKHTPPGTTVVTSVSRSPEGAAMVTVTDDGGGIPAEFVDHVFSRFARADAARKGSGDQTGASAAEGTSGLGLSIVQSIVEAHGGRVTVTSQPGRTQFALQLPLPRTKQGDLQQA
ncbi:HAMP domain-containing histidine kinase [Pseudarthrobacter phenanthrenivorans]|uniref:histidine kinase n=1 Tax=Pseudarthrobacter phenanthrenivorans (strain DSM 18606 / JCM 16027 / LMG 23796 / Sphe3) TaxID=930171 RepID=F0MAG8_PSEPM|nr:HAMP domain-containing sensor histidine kinase [Pseudarthrobacter phenanthrenivorans]ADX72836.1 signal transduction histidine kinase [Pseudarthrobacter phenanthrenivorans Sphe3]TPV53508.1 HAMP domain-containing histidine kinase [Pseudarthrobacter phenanthrenivorans]